MFNKLKALFGGAEEVTSIVISPGPPPRGGVLSLASNGSIAKKSKQSRIKEIFSAEHVGGKGANLMRLRAAGLKVPPFLLVPASEWDYALEKASEAAAASMDRWMKESSSKDNEKIAAAIDSVELSEEVMALLKAFIGSDSKRAFAVRSSATVEDGSDSAFAGQFTTVLNVHGMDNIVKAIKTCWKSLLTESVKPFYNKNLVTQPRMAVVVQEQIDSDKAGVYFQANPVTGATSTHVVNCTFGQGEGVVSGTVPSDEFWLSSDTGKCFKRVVVKKSERIGLAEAMDGTRKEAVDAAYQEGAVLSDEQLRELFQESRKIKSAFVSPQDVEFGFTKSGELYVFQSRPITTRLERMKFEPGDVGLWRLNAHVSVPMSALYAPIWLEGWAKGCTYNSKLTGSGFAAVDTVCLNGFGYFCLRFPGPKAPPTAPPPKFLMRTILALTGGKDTKAARLFWEKKSYLDFHKQFQETLKPDWIRRHHELQKEADAVKTREDALKHLDRAYQHMIEAWYAHVTYTLPQMLPAAYFVQKAVEWTKCEQAEAWSCLEGFSPVTGGVAGEFAAQIKALKQSEEARSLLAKTETPAESIQTLRNLPGDVGQAAEKIIGDMEYRLMSGYDPANAIIKENPKFLLNVIRAACEKSVHDPENDAIPAEKASEELKKRVPIHKQGEFDEILTDMRSVMRLRDERALYTDLWASGILHDAVLRCADIVEHNNVSGVSATGERLRRLMLEGTIEEIRAATANGATPEMLQQWRERKTHRETASIRDAPDLIGGVDIEITPEHFPNEWLARSFTTMMIATRQIATPPDFEHQYQAVDDFLNESHKVVFGVPASRGIVEGTVCLIKTEEDIDKLEKGQIVITESPSSLINLVLPFASGIVCDFGATLSHAAVCAREMNLPCVMGTKIATLTFKHGQRIRVNGTTGKVELIE